METEKLEIYVGLCVKDVKRTVKEPLQSFLKRDYSREQINLVVVDGNGTNATLPITRNLISRTDVRC